MKHILLKLTPKSGSAFSGPDNRRHSEMPGRLPSRKSRLGRFPRLGTTLLPCIWVLIGSLTLNPANSAEVVDRIVAVVNDDIILLSDVNNLVNPFKEKVRAMGYPEEQQARMLYQIREDIIKKMIEQKLTDQQVEKYGLTISEEEITRAIERLKEKRSLTDEDLRRGLATDNLTMEEFRHQMKNQLLRTRLVDYEVKSRIVITDADVKEYYEKHPEIYGGQKQYHLRNIILRVSSYASDDERRMVKEKMNTIYGQLEAGADFAEMARRFSESSLAAEGGDLGLFKLDDMAPALKEAIESIPAGAFTPILDTDQGYQIFYVERIVTDPSRSLESVSKEIEQKLYEEQLDSKFSAWLEDLRKRSHIKIVR